MPLIAFITRVTAKAGKRDALAALNRSVCAESQREPGTLVYVMSQNKDNPDEFWYLDVYADQAAFDAHNASDAYKRMIGSIGDLTADIQATPLEPFAAKQFLEVNDSPK